MNQAIKRRSQKMRLLFNIALDVVPSTSQIFFGVVLDTFQQNKLIHSTGQQYTNS